MWSGPRNLSTAMMYSFASRSDFAVWDEPFYAPYLAATGLPHPMADEIMAHHETDPAVIAARCIGPVPRGRRHFYMKHMPHHMIDGMPMDWAKTCINIHLIRHPARVIASYAAKRETVTLDDIGYRQQSELYAQIGGIVIDSSDIRAAPETMLRRLCAALDLHFDPAMLAWPKGGHPDDGIWAAHWYGAIHKSQGFAGAEGPLPELTGPQETLLAQAMPYFAELSQKKIAGNETIS